MKSIFAALCLVAGLSAGAQAGLPVRQKLIDDLFVRLRQAEDAQGAAQFRAMIGEVWSHSGSPTADLLMSRAETALRGQRGDLANRLLDRILALYPDWEQAWRRRAQSALAQGDREGATLDLEKALGIEPRDFLAMKQLSELLRGSDKKQEALELLRRAAELDPQDPALAHEIEDLTREVEGRGI